MQGLAGSQHLERRGAVGCELIEPRGEPAIVLSASHGVDDLCQAARLGDDLVRQLASLHDQLQSADHAEAGDLRHRAGWIIRALHHCRARQADLVFDALEMDLGER